MEKEFVPYEQALALKELGFDEACFGFYNNIDKNVWIKHTIDESIKDIYTGDFEAPTFSQAFRWFREKYGLRHSIFEIENKNKISGSIKGTCKNNFKHYSFIDFYDTDEEAELECLKKLIEIVKEQ